MKQQLGLTLIELIVVLAVAAIITTTAIPGFQSLIQNNRMSTTVHAFVTSLHLARSEAVKRGDNITICKSADTSTCTTAGGWDQGWIVFVDKNGNGVRETASEELIRAQSELIGGTTINGQDDVDTYISYSGTGFTRKVGGGTLNTSKSTLIFCDKRKWGDHAKAIFLTSTGSVRLTSATDPSVNADILSAASCSV